MDSDPAGFLVRPARLEDAAAIAVLCGQLGYLSSAVQVSRRLEQMAGFPFHALYVAETGGQISGWAHVHAYPLPEMDFHAELGGLVVAEAHRGSGVGKALLAAAEEWARRNGCRELWLRSNVIRTEAHRFYQGRGYDNIKSQHTFRKHL
ncbi:MAG: GNAT family N-acetyltransferase [Chloroflexi bacterium]|nr:GNAT family N-acetyltransferase [Chloroflexota bacterium]